MSFSEYDPSKSNNDSNVPNASETYGTHDCDPAVASIIADAREAEDAINDDAATEDTIEERLLLLNSSLDRNGLRSGTVLVTGMLRTSLGSIVDDIDLDEALGLTFPDPVTDMIGKHYPAVRMPFAVVGFDVETVSLDVSLPGITGSEYKRLTLGIVPSEDYQDETPWFEMHIDDIRNLELPDGSKNQNRDELRKLLPEALRAIDKIIADIDTYDTAGTKQQRREKRILRALQALVIEINWATIDTSTYSRRRIIELLEEYISDEIGFDIEEPYRIKIDGEMSARRMDGTFVTSDYTGIIAARVRRVLLSEVIVGSSSTLQPLLEVRLPLSGDNTGHVLVQIAPESVERIRSQRMRSLPFSLELIERATLSSALPELDGHHELLPVAYTGRQGSHANTPEEEAAYIAQEGIELEKKLVSEYNDLDSDYDRMVYSDMLLQRILRQARSVGAKVYKNEADALDPYMQLRSYANVLTYIQLEGDSRDLFMVSGSGVSFMRYNLSNSYDPSKREYTVRLAYPPRKTDKAGEGDSAIFGVEHGDFTNEYAAHFIECEIERLPVDESDEDGEYYIAVKIRFETKTKPSRVVEIGDDAATYASLELKEWIIADAAQEVFVRNFALDKQRQRSELRAELTGNSDFASKISGVTQELLSILSEFDGEDPTDPTSLRGTKNLHTIDDLLTGDRDQRQAAADALKIAIGVGSHISLVGDIFSHETGANDMVDAEESEITIQLADVVSDSAYTSGITLVGSIVEDDILDAGGGELVYVPIRTIRMLNF